MSKHKHAGYFEKHKWFHIVHTLCDFFFHFMYVIDIFVSIDILHLILLILFLLIEQFTIFMNR